MKPSGLHIIIHYKQFKKITFSNMDKITYLKMHKKQHDVLRLSLSLIVKCTYYIYFSIVKDRTYTFDLK